MKYSTLLALAALTCGNAFAQAPAGTLQTPAAQTDPINATGPAGVKAEAKVDARKGASANASAGMASKPMDANGDGMISKKEWDQHHAAMWGSMKSKNGMMPRADVEATLKGGPN
jgi:hypothetical protein